MKIEIIPSFKACLNIFGVAGETIPLMFSLMVLSFIILAASLKSSILPFVQEPIYTWSTLVSLNSEIFLT